MLAASVFSALPYNARMLCVGAGTGAEIHFLTDRFPGWTFVAVEPSAGMVGAARSRAEAHGYDKRCEFHTGYLESLPESAPFDAATSLLVSQFILDRRQRTEFFQAIADRLKPESFLVTSDLSSDTSSPLYPGLLEVWMQTLSGADLSAERMQQMRAAYDKDVAILPPASVEAIIASGGFHPPVQCYQAGLIRAWYARRHAS